MYKYFSYSRPVSIGTIPNKKDVDFRFTNFSERRWCEEIAGSAWGFVEVDKPYTRKECHDYELIPEKKTFEIKVLLDPEEVQAIIDRRNSDHWEVRPATTDEYLQFLTNLNMSYVVEAIFNGNSH